jgi:micrococcal nuclease
LNVVDGDTVDLRTDLGFKLFFDQRFRLFGINTPELNSKDQTERARAIQAKDFVSDRILKQRITVNSHKDKTEKYGRYLASIYYQDEDSSWHCLNDDLVEAGLAVRAQY